MSYAWRQRYLWSGCAGIVLLSMLCTDVWSDSDKTTIDLERGLPEASSRYHRLRAEQRYQSDKTKIDLATPLTRIPTQEPSPSQRPATLITPTPAPRSGR